MSTPIGGWRRPDKALRSGLRATAAAPYRGFRPHLSDFATGLVRAAAQFGRLSLKIHAGIALAVAVSLLLWSGILFLVVSASS